MKQLVLLLMVSFSFVNHAQWGYKDEKIASRFKPGFMWYNTGWKPAEAGKDRKYDRLMVDISYNQWLNPKSIGSAGLTSLGWNVHTCWDIPLTIGNSISFGTGLSYKHRRVGLSGTLIEFGDSTVYHPDLQQPGTLNKQILGIHSLSIPLELRFRPKKFKQVVKFHVGGSVGYAVQSYQKLAWNKNQIIIKNKQLTDLNGLFYGVHARVGFRNWALFGDYQLNPMFHSKNSTQGSILSLGLSVSLF